MTHRLHPLPHDPDDAILYDNCDDCQRRSLYLPTLIAGLDRDNMAALWDRMVEVEHGTRDRYATATEGDACRLLYAVAIMLERVGLDPWRPLADLGSHRIGN